MTVKTVRLIGGPADGCLITVQENTKTLAVPVMPTEIRVNVDLLAYVIGWDDYGPIFDHGIKQVIYKISGDVGIYEP